MYDNQHYSYYDGNGESKTRQHDENLILEDQDYVLNYENGEDFEKYQYRKVTKVNGFHNIFYKDELKKARDFYNNENEGLHFHKSEEHENRFEDPGEEIKKVSHSERGIRSIVTSRKVVEKSRTDPQEEIWFCE